MIDEYNTFIKKREKQIIIDHSFPKDLLINIMKPYLELFLKSQYSLLYTYLFGIILRTTPFPIIYWLRVG